MKTNLIFLAAFAFLMLQAYSPKAQCSSCSYTATANGSFNLNGNQTLCITGNVDNLNLNLNGSNNTICIAENVTWTHSGNLSINGTTTINVYGTFNMNGSYNLNNSLLINVKPGGHLKSNTRGFQNNITINNEGTVTFTSTEAVTHTGRSFYFNNIGVGSKLIATASSYFNFAGGTNVTNQGTMDFRNLENGDGYLFWNMSGGVITIGGYFYNHGGLLNDGVINTVCGKFGEPGVACGFLLGDKGASKTFNNKGCLSVEGDVTLSIGFNDGILIVKPAAPGTGNLTINKPIIGTNGAFYVQNGYSKITNDGMLTGTNMKFYSETTNTHDFNLKSGNQPSNYTIEKVATTCEVDPGLPPITPLPVTLKYFKVLEENRIAAISWATTSETNSERFDVERSGDGKSWYRLGSVPAQGESAKLKTYSFSDASPLSGENLYRLKIVDRDGTFTFSTLQSFLTSEKNDLSIFPNPVTDVLKISVPDWKKVRALALHNMNGEVVYTTNSEPVSGIDVRALPAGAYIVLLQNYDGVNRSYKVLIAK